MIGFLSLSGMSVIMHVDVSNNAIVIAAELCTPRIEQNSYTSIDR